MDKKLRQSFRPYSFRARMLLMLTISAVVASMISLVFSYGYSRSTVRTEMTDTQLELAASLTALYEYTGLSPEVVAQMEHRENLLVTVVSPDMRAALPEEARALVGSAACRTLPGPGGMPCTYVSLGDTLLAIMPSKQFNVFLIAFLRISFAAISFFSVFMLMSMLATWRIARPVSLLTKATKSVGNGDFTVRLPEDRSDEMGHLMRSFNSMTAALDRTAYLQKDFIASVSHEFRTPIASIKGFARLLQMPELTPQQQQEYVAMIAQESDRLSRLSSTLLRLSALEQQTAPAELQTFRLDEQIRQVILRMEPTWSARNIDWQLELSQVSVTSDSELLTQVWVNLLQNAIKFSPDGAAIEVQVYAQNHNACFVVRDHGVGMDAETLSRIFDRFYQADRSRSREGVGLGLTLVRRILDLLGGAIHVDSVPGEGAAFTVTLPCIIKSKEDQHV